MYPTVIPVGDEASNRVAGRGEELLLQYSTIPPTPWHTLSRTSVCVWFCPLSLWPLAYAALDWLELWLGFCFATKTLQHMWGADRPWACNSHVTVASCCLTAPVVPGAILRRMFHSMGWWCWKARGYLKTDTLGQWDHMLLWHLLTKRKTHTCAWCVSPVKSLHWDHLTSISCATLCKLLQLRLHSIWFQRWKRGTCTFYWLHVLSLREGFTTYGQCTPSTCASMHRQDDLAASEDVCC